jgi:hypothetical protein
MGTDLRRGGKYQIVGIGRTDLDVLNTLLKRIALLSWNPLKEHQVDEHDR